MTTNMGYICRIIHDPALMKFSIEFRVRGLMWVKWGGNKWGRTREKGHIWGMVGNKADILGVLGNRWRSWDVRRRKAGSKGSESYLLHTEITWWRRSSRISLVMVDRLVQWGARTRSYSKQFRCEKMKTKIGSGRWGRGQSKCKDIFKTERLLLDSRMVQACESKMD